VGQCLRHKRCVPDKKDCRERATSIGWCRTTMSAGRLTAPYWIQLSYCRLLASRLGRDRQLVEMMCLLLLSAWIPSRGLVYNCVKNGCIGRETLIPHRQAARVGWTLPGYATVFCLENAEISENGVGKTCINFGMRGKKLDGYY
jgi:hypothetical protein